MASRIDLNSLSAFIVVAREKSFRITTHDHAAWIRQ